MSALKAYWTVKAAVLPSRLTRLRESDPEMNEIYERFLYTSEDYEHDAQLPEDAPTTRFMQRMEEAHERAKQITNPARVNIVTVEFIWV